MECWITKLYIKEKLNNMKLKVVNNSRNQLPQYQTEGAAGLDVCSKMNIDIQPGETKLIQTGLYVEIPEGYEIQVRPRSGLAYKHSVTVLNSPGTIDADYRGEIGVILINHGKEVFKVIEGDRIAQLVLSKVEQIKWDPVLILSESVRNTSGFGSTGK
jgi:dUTP pyrophosphatase